MTVSFGNISPFLVFKMLYCIHHFTKLVLRMTAYYNVYPNYTQKLHNIKLLIVTPNILKP